MNKNGFVFVETIIVASVLTFTLLMLFSSYEYLLRKCNERSEFDTTDVIYQTYYVKDTLKKLANGNTIKEYLVSTGLCSTVLNSDAGTGYICDLSSINDTNQLYGIKDAFEIEKIYYLPLSNLNGDNANSWLSKFDATTIDYLRSLGKSYSSEDEYLVVKYVKSRDLNASEGLKDKSETLHSSIIINS